MDYDAIVIGGGPPGAAAARQLARRRRRVLLVSALAGDWRPSLANRLRLEAFFAVVAAQRLVPLAPRSHSGC